VDKDYEKLLGEIILKGLVQNLARGENLVFNRTKQSHLIYVSHLIGKLPCCYCTIYICSFITTFWFDYPDHFIYPFPCKILFLSWLLDGFPFGNNLNLTLKPETISKTLVNQMLLFFGIIFSSQVEHHTTSLYYCRI
jgi:hypothetical protein